LLTHWQSQCASKFFIVIGTHYRYLVSLSSCWQPSMTLI